MNILGYSDWKLNEQNTSSFKVYTLPNRENYIYRRAGDRWQFQYKSTTRKDIWHRVENNQSINLLKSQYIKNKAKSKTNMSNSIPVNVNTQSYWTLIAIIACENYIDNKQGMADVAQSIYNRFNINGKLYGKTIFDIIISQNQYQPVTDGISKGANWNSIDTLNKSILAYMKTKGVDKTTATGAINNAVSAQKDSKLISNAKKHVGSRTEFLSTLPNSSKAISPVERSPFGSNNAFFWNYAGKTNYYDKQLLAATSKPGSVLIS